MSKIIDKNQANRALRWEHPLMEEFATTGERSTEYGPLTAEQLEEIQNQAYQEAYEAGFKKGAEDGRKESERENQPKLEMINRILNVLSEPVTQMDKEVEKLIVQLIILITQQLVRREIKIQEGQIIGIVKEALSALPLSARSVYIYLHPEDAQVVSGVFSGDEKTSYYSVVEDATLSRGDCKIATDTSTLDATVEKRVAAIITEMLGGERQRDLQCDGRTQT